MKQEQGNTPMTPIQIVLYATGLFFALLSLLRWKLRRGASSARVRRSFRLYATRVLADLSAEVPEPRWTPATLRAA